MKTCIECQQAKPLEDFWRMFAGEERRQPRCKECDRKARVRSLHGPACKCRRCAGAPEPRWRRVPASAVDFVRQEDGSLVRVRR